jgi:hypothetical protein
MFSKAPTDKITLSREGRKAEITDAERLEQFRFGGGPGNCNPSPHPETGLPWAEGCSDPRAGWIADWISGSIPEPDTSLPRYEVTTHFGSGEKRQYVVYFVYSPITRKGYIYLPGPKEAHYWENVSLLGRGKQWEGHWFLATPAWTSAAQELIARLR